MYPRIDFERRTEGFKTNPDWYLSELAIQPHLQNLKDSLTSLVQNAQSLFDTWIATAEAANFSGVRREYSAREAEYWSKIEFQFHVVRRQSDELNAESASRVCLGRRDLDATEEGIKTRRRLLLQRMAEDVTALIAIERPDAYPDFAGQFLHTVGESLIAALIENDTNLFKEVFHRYFISSLMQYDRIGANVNRSNLEAAIAVKVSIAPVLDLMSLVAMGFSWQNFMETPLLPLLFLVLGITFWTTARLTARTCCHF